MRKIWVITRREFLMTVTRKAYIASVIGVPLFFVAIGGLTGVGVSRIDSALSKGDQTLGVIDPAGVIDPKLTEMDLPDESSGASPQALLKTTYTIKFYPRLEEGLQDLRETKLAVLYVVERDYLESSTVAMYTRQGGLLSRASMPGRNELHKLLRASLLQNQVKHETLDLVLNPTTLKEYTVMEDGTVRPPSTDLGELSSFLLPFGMAFLMTFSVFLSAGYLLQTTVEEKENRVIEIILSSVKPEELLWGKVLGLGGAAMLQVVIYLALVGIVSVSFLAFIDLRPLNLLISLIYCVFGYLLFASLLAATGIIGGNLRESSQLSTIWTLTAMIPFMLGSVVFEDPNGTIARVLSFVPLTAPVAMIMRLSVTRVPILDVLLSLGVLFGGIYLAMRGAAKIFRAASLMYGKRPSLPEIVRWLRQA